MTKNATMTAIQNNGMSRKKGQPEPQHPEPTFDFLVPIRPNADPNDRSHYRVLGPDEKLPEECIRPIIKHMARLLLDILKQEAVAEGGSPTPDSGRPLPTESR